MDRTISTAQLPFSTSLILLALAPTPILERNYGKDTARYVFLIPFIATKLLHLLHSVWLWILFSSKLPLEDHVLITLWSDLDTFEIPSILSSQSTASFFLHMPVIVASLKSNKNSHLPWSYHWFQVNSLPESHSSLICLLMFLTVWKEKQSRAFHFRHSGYLLVDLDKAEVWGLFSNTRFLMLLWKR